MPEKHLRREAVEEIVGLSTTTLHWRMVEETSPCPIKVGSRAVA